MMIQDIETSREVASAIFGKTKSIDAVIIASSDMTHYEHQSSAIVKDKTALDMITQLDIEGLYKIIESENMSICGYGPIAVLMHCAKLSGLSEVILAAYKTSGDVTGDYAAR